MTLPKQLKAIQAIAVIIAAIIYLGARSCSITKSTPFEQGAAELHYVARVIDGDTLKLSEDQKVRLIGVDTPEEHYSDKLLKDSKKLCKDIKVIQALGVRASIYTRNLCLNKRVRLEYDVKKRDRYDRLLAYVYLEDGTFVNARIIEAGFARTMIIPPNVKHAEYLRKLEDRARNDKKGLWKYY